MKISSDIVTTSCNKEFRLAFIGSLRPIFAHSVLHCSKYKFDVQNFAQK